ncbi:MAG: DUF58 domain-containing protein [Kiritimatiellales bacterium]|nr:DUF58 domain-containing protein [Kiritimatiellales bacterium]
MQTVHSSEFLDSRLLSQLPTLELRARYLVDGFLSGLHQSPYQGSSVEFREYRDYQPGDELKRIDWKAYARTDRLHVRLMEDETNVTVYLLVDQSGSMSYRGTTALMTKWAYTQSLAAAFLLFLHQQHDAVSLGFAGEGLADFSPGSSKPSQLHRMMIDLHRNANHTESRLAKSLFELAAQVRKRSIVVVFSDFYEEVAALKSAVANLRHFNCEVLFCQVLDPGELNLELNDTVLLQDMETQEELMLSPDLIRKEYATRFHRHCKDLSHMVRQLGGDYLLLNTSILPMAALSAYLHQRKVKK